MHFIQVCCERETELINLQLDGQVGAPKVVGPTSDDEGYVSPEFDLPSDSGSEEEEAMWAPPPAKRSKTTHAEPRRTAMEDDEELALRLLRQRQ